MRTLRPPFTLKPRWASYVRKYGYLRLFTLSSRDVQFVSLDLIHISNAICLGRIDDSVGSISHTYEDFIMARKGDWNLVNIRLNEDDKKKLSEFYKQNPLNAVECIEHLGTKGYKVSFTWVSKQNAWCVSVTGTKNSDKNDGSTITSWSGDLEEALFMGIYKDEQLCKNGNWSDFEREVSNWG